MRRFPPWVVAVAGLCLAFLPSFAGAAGRGLTVSAAASLTDAFREVAAAFERFAGTAVVLNMAASGVLVRQVEQGAPVDVLATADAETMDRAQALGLLLPGTRADFATNRLVLAAPSGAPQAPSGLWDLGVPGAGRVALGNPAFVPAGRYARAALEAEGLWGRLQGRVVLAESVRQVLDYLRRGEVDAGFVFVTDLPAAEGRVRVVAEVALPALPRYPIAVAAATRDAAAARRFVAFVTGAEGRRVLAAHGFGSP